MNEIFENDLEAEEIDKIEKMFKDFVSSLNLIFLPEETTFKKIFENSIVNIN